MKAMHRITLLSALALLASSGLARAEDLLIRAGTVHTMTGPPLKPGAVLITGGKIARVAKEIAPPAGVRVLDLKDGVLMPGLVNAYSNLGISGSSSEVTREVSPDYRVLPAIDWLSRDFRAALEQGITTTRIAPGTEGVYAGLACEVKTAGKEKDRVVARDSALVLTMASDPGGANRSRTRPDTIYVRQPTNRMGVIWILRNTLHKARTRDDLDLAPVRQALGGKLPALVVSRTEHDIAGTLRVAKEFKFTPTLVGGYEAYKVARELAEAKVPVILGPVPTGGLSGPESTEVVWNQAGVLHKAGVTCALAGSELLEQARFAVRFGLPRAEALRAITVTPAQLLGLDKRVGSLAPGLDADLIALDGDPLEVTTRLRWVMVDGTVHNTGK